MRDRPKMYKLCEMRVVAYSYSNMKQWKMQENVILIVLNVF